jgi:hypothetical protein|tara:strand:+ start:433 stop:732 length:300 start_codon:yes stop_codon:yes gene_type:complete
LDQHTVLVPLDLDLKQVDGLAAVAAVDLYILHLVIQQIEVMVAETVVHMPEVEMPEILLRHQDTMMEMMVYLEQVVEEDVQLPGKLINMVEMVVVAPWL